LPRIVVDANRILSALLRDGPTRAALVNTAASLYAPSVLRAEIERHIPEVARRAGIPLQELRAVMDALLRRIRWVPEDAYRPHLASARAALRPKDVKDAHYLACALAVGADAIWSHDLGFDHQQLVPRVPHPDAWVEGSAASRPLRGPAPRP